MVVPTANTLEGRLLIPGPGHALSSGGSSPRAGWDATMDIGGWLRGLGLGQYEATFRESEIDAEVLPELTESDLSQLGVPLGHRKRLLKAIAALGAESVIGRQAHRLEYY
jgi:SAM domain (Sterile alpha motif)